MSADAPQRARGPLGVRRIGALLEGLLPGLLLCALAFWAFDWLGAGLYDPINHGENEDWDWQLTFYEASRTILIDYRQIPTWTPWTQGGVPLWANPEAPFLYPPFLLILAMGTDAGIKVWILLHLWLLVLGGWIAGREIGLSPLGAHGAALLSLASAFIPGFIAYGHVMFLPLGWLPLAWVALRRGRWPWAAAALAMSFLSGGHYLLVYGALWLGLDGLLRGLDAGRLRWLTIPLALNGLLLGQRWATIPLGLGLLAALAIQRPRALKRTLPPVILAGLLAGLLLGAKLLPAPPLFERAERLAAQVSLSIADPYTPWMAWEALTGAIERPSGHEGQNVFWSGIPVLVGLIGMGWAGWRRPAWGVMAWIWWSLGWGGSTPLNPLEILHRLPGFDHLRVVERYSLVWTLFLGWGFGAALDQLRARLGWLGGAMGVGLIAAYLYRAAPEAAGTQRLGPGRAAQLAPGGFVQVEDELTNYEAVRANRGKLDCWTTAWLEDPSPALRAVGHPEYRGEVWIAETGAPIEAELLPGSIRFTLDAPGTVVVNQNAFRGWTVDGEAAGARDGLLSAALPAGAHAFRYRTPGLLPGALTSLVGLALLAGCARRRGPAPGASSSAPPPGTDPRRS